MGIKIVTQILRGTEVRNVIERILRRIIGPKRDEIIGKWRKLNKVMRRLIICTANQILLGP
jgi:hypothetical protein